MEDVDCGASAGEVGGGEKFVSGASAGGVIEGDAGECVEGGASAGRRIEGEASTCR